MKNNFLLSTFVTILILFGFLFFTHIPNSFAYCAGNSFHSYTEYTCDLALGCVGNTFNSAPACVNVQGACGACITVGQTCSSLYDSVMHGYDCVINTIPGSTPCGGTEQLYLNGCDTTPPNCTGGSVCGACGGGSEPGNTCGTTGGSMGCTLTQPQQCQDVNYTAGCTYGYDNCAGGFGCPGGGGHVACTTNLYVHVFKDYNHDGNIDGGETGFGGINVNDGGGGITTDGNGNGTFGGEKTGNYTVTAGIPGGWANSNADPRGFTITTGNANSTINFGFTPLFSISGKIFYDLNEDGKLNNGETGVQKGTLKVNGNTITINADGTYTDNNLWSGSYTVSYTPAAGYQTIYPTTDYTVTVGTPGKNPACNDGNYNDDSCDGNGNIINLNVGTTPLHTISGTVYNDINEDFYDDGPDTPYTAGGTVTLSGKGSGTTSLSTTDGTYTFNNLESGQYTVTYSPPANYHTTYPVPPQFTVTVGGPIGSGSPQPCNANNYHNTSCNATGNILGLDFGISNSNEWDQGTCTDVRIDGTVAGGGGSAAGFTDLIPASANCGGTSSPYAVITNTGSAGGGGSNTPYSTTSCVQPGVVFTGDIDANFGEGAANVNNWVIGGNTYGEVFTPRTQDVIATSYEALTANFAKTGTTTTDLTTVCTLNNCTLPANLPDGVYQANGNVTLNTYTFPASTNNMIHSYIFHINGTLTINGNIIVPVGTSALFSTTGNITVASTVGESDATSTNGDVEGLFTTDQSFIVDSSYAAGQHCDFATGNPKDLKLNLEGVVIVNAGNTGGTFQVQRDLCHQNRSCPTATVANRADMLLSLPLVARNSNSLFQETAP